MSDISSAGSIVVDGHELHEDDLRLMYTFDQTSGTPSQYEAHSDAQVLVLLDVTPDQSMVDEGVAREVINRIQKLRKKGHLVPSDEITVYYSSQPAGEYLDKVIQAHTDFIFATTKAPLKPYPVAKNASVIVQEKTQLKGSDLDLTIVRGAAVSRTPLTTAACAYVNLRVMLKDKQQEGVVLLENPKGDNILDVERLKTVCCSVFGLNGAPVTIFNGKTALNAQTDLMALSGKTLTVTSGSSPADVSSSDSLLCPYVNLQLVNASPAECQTGDVATLLLMNPEGKNALQFPDLLHETAKVFGLRGRKLMLFMNEELTEGQFVSSWKKDENNNEEELITVDSTSPAQPIMSIPEVSEADVSIPREQRSKATPTGTESLDTFPNVYICLRLYLTLPISNWSGEQSFSVLKRVKNYIRSSVTERMLNNIALLAIENTSMDYEEEATLTEEYVFVRELGCSHDHKDTY
ncbi:isoleucine--tRNA cytoplasmic [Labeo rohita]|uniref:Isoleucine--tRNA cytoplasmic n=1 Tax=Labeo rohita TaxID=84645 RepID=A0A498NJC2_LABRO|nr:isoleucine--tRNA cytoplasmic [Labeo rohita]